MTTWLIIVAALVLLIFFVIGIYNALVSLQNRYKNAFSQIEIQLKRRHDLIPNLVETAKGYIKHERGTLEAVTAARKQAEESLERAKGDPGDPKAMERLAGAENALTGALGRLFAVVEAYPDLKANQTMLKLQEELTSTENKVSFSRQAYNDSAMNFNIYRQTFPAVLIANLVGFREDASLLEFEKGEIERVPEVSF